MTATEINFFEVCPANPNYIVSLQTYNICIYSMGIHVKTRDKVSFVNCGYRES